MIAKGNLHTHGQKLAAYLITGKKEERAELVELRGFAAITIREAFMDVQLAAEATRCERPFFHAHVRLPDEEALSREQWLEVADRLGRALGFDGQGRAVAFHQDRRTGERHLHVAWSRIDLEQMRSIDPGLYKNKLKQECRQLEEELGLKRLRNERDPEEKTLSAGRNEFEQARRLGTDLKSIREDIRACWEQSDSGQSFAVALDEKGYILARGDRRDFVVIDPAGGDHALGKRIAGVGAAEIRARMGDIDKTQLLSVDEAKGVQEALSYDRSANEREAGIEQSGVTEREQLTPDEQEQALAQGTGAAGRDGMKSPGDVAGGLGDGVVEMLSAVVDVFADFIAPSAPPTKDQVQRARQENAAKAERDAKARRLDEINEAIRATQARAAQEEQERAREQKRRREREEPERDR